MRVVHGAPSPLRAKTMRLFQPDPTPSLAPDAIDPSLLSRFRIPVVRRTKRRGRECVSMWSMNTEAFWSAVTGSTIVVTLFGFWMNNFFGKYLARKAENLATHEDIQKLVDQVRETERVKADITDSVWDRQQRWNAKRDLYIQVFGAVYKLCDDALGISEHRRLVLERKAKEDDGPVLHGKTALDELGRISFLSPLFMSDTAAKALTTVNVCFRELADLIVNDKIGAREYADAEGKLSLRLNHAIVDFTTEARKDLGFQGTEKAWMADVFKNAIDLAH